MAVEVALEPAESGGIAGEVDRLHPLPPVWVPSDVEDREWTRCRNVLAVADVEADVDALFRSMCNTLRAGHECRGLRGSVTSLPPQLVWLLNQHQREPSVAAGPPRAQYVERSSKRLIVLTSAGGGGAPHSFKESGRGSLQQMTKGRRKPWRLRLPTGTGPSTSRSYVLDQDADKHPSCQCWPEPSKTLPVEHSS